MIKILFSLLLINTLFANAESDVKLDALIHYHPAQEAVIIDYDPFVHRHDANAISKANDMAHLTNKRAIHLVAIINQKAFINGQWYRVGQSIDGQKIIRIHEQSIELKKANKITILGFEEARELLHVKDSKK